MSPRLGIERLHHVSVGVDDLEEARRFYTEVLGLTELDTRPDFGFPGAWLDLGVGQLHLVPSSEPIGPLPGAPHFALQVDDLEAVAEAIEARGIEVRRSNYTRGAGRQAFLTDPSGNLIELNQPDA
jgi:catechol 2,3-dioxygenase-like lactoylglutathione lyase family enzyme